MTPTDNPTAALRRHVAEHPDHTGGATETEARCVTCGVEWRRVPALTHRIAPPGCLPTDPTVCGTESRLGDELVDTSPARAPCPRCLCLGCGGEEAEARGVPRHREARSPHTCGKSNEGWWP